MTSAKLMPDALTSIRAWPGPGWGSGRSWTCRTEGSPCLVMTTARMAPTLSRGEWDPMPARPTGLSSQDAQDDFQRARRRQIMARMARVLTGQGDVDVILPFDEVVAALGRAGERNLGLQVIALDTIVGTVDRATGFDREFRPTTARVRTRWERVAA